MQLPQRWLQEPRAGLHATPDTCVRMREERQEISGATGFVPLGSTVDDAVMVPPWTCVCATGRVCQTKLTITALDYR